MNSLNFAEILQKVRNVRGLLTGGGGGGGVHFKSQLLEIGKVFFRFVPFVNDIK